MVNIIILIVIVLIVIEIMVIYIKNINIAYKKFNSQDFKTIDTSLGKINYAEEGAGSPVLIMHGIFGGYDQGLISGKSFFDENYRIIAPARFGYTGSEIPEVSDCKNQVKSYKEFLDKLGISKVILMGTSAGGPPAIRFAVEYPERVKALILISSSVPTKNKVEGPTGPPSVIYNDFVMWLLTKFVRTVFFNMFGVDRKEYTNSSNEDKNTFDGLFETMLPVKPRKQGIINDTNIINKEMADYELSDIKVPVLMMNAKDDPMVKILDSKKAVETIPDITFVEFDKGGHLLYGNDKKIKEELKRFLDKIE